ncbi:MAG TPA: SBBP repeat-containing protein, partial [Candidatus Sulfopaludibacter sp.]|nr:SBBP repeat-containing protein [Candidatus Sulfopaludibacter sp.]
MWKAPPWRRRFCAFGPAAAVPTATPGVACCLIFVSAILHAQTLLNTRTLSGAGTDTPAAIATDSQGNVYLAGSTNSPDFPITRALFAQLPEPALRVSGDGRTFSPSTLSIVQVNSVATSADGAMVLVGANSGLYRSADGGVTWTQPAGVTGQVLALALDPVNPNNAYAVGLATSTSAGPGSGSFFTNWTWTIYKSIDGGWTWQALAAYTLSPMTAAVSRIVINPLNPSILYAFVNSALLQSADAGASWQPLTIPAAQANLGQTNPTAFAIAPSQPNIAYATTFSTPLMRSADGGATWQPAAALQSAGENAIAVDPRDPSVVWLVNGAGIQKSTDGGATFQRVAVLGDGSWQSIAVSAANSSQVFATDPHNVYATYDGGATWSTVVSGQIDAVFATPGRIYVAAT